MHSLLISFEDINKERKREMAVLSLTNVTKYFGDNLVLSDISFDVYEGRHIGLVGINGSGKTTLFKLIAGEYAADEGHIAISKDATIGYMEQHVCRDLKKTAFEEVMTVFSHFMEMEKELEIISKRLSGALGGFEQEELIHRQAYLNDEYVSEGGLTFRNRVRSTLTGLGFSQGEMENTVETLSGGQKAKLQLAKMLLGEADLLLLDEPTNHLDIESVEWLEEFLKSYNGTYIVVSHDRYFLDKICTDMIELLRCKITFYKGNYSDFIRQREERRLAAQRAYQNTQKEITRIEGIIEQQKRWNQERNYVTIASKQKSIDRLESTLEKPEDDPGSLRFSFHTSRRGGNDVLRVRGVSLSFGETQIFEDVNMEIKRAQKVFLIGSNGCGKTSLFKILLGIYKATGGEVRLGAGIDTGYYEQAQSGLDDDKTVIDEVWDMYPEMTMGQLRNALAVFLFRGEQVFKKVGALSGGERARVLLLKLMLSKTNFLLLDEPTNHLDITSREALEQALSDYDGTLFIISHDRYLINKLADRIYYLDKDGTTEYLGNYDYYIKNRRVSPMEEIGERSEEERGGGYRQKKELESQKRKCRTALSRCEDEISITDEKIGEVEAALALPDTSSDYERVLELTHELSELHVKSEELLLQWGELTDRLEELENT